MRSWVVGAPTLLECVTRVSHCLGARARGGGGEVGVGKGGEDPGGRVQERMWRFGLLN